MSKKLTSAYDSLGVEKVNEMEAMAPEGLRKTIIESFEAMQAVADELDANTKYQAAKEACKDLSAGKREVDKRQKAVILVALSLLNK